MKSKKSIRKNIRIKRGDVFKCSTAIRLASVGSAFSDEDETNRIQIRNGVFKITFLSKDRKSYTVRFLTKTTSISIRARIDRKFIKSDCVKVPRIKAELLYKN